MFNVNKAKEAINQFKRWEKSGWSKSEVPNTYMLILAVEALEEKINKKVEFDYDNFIKDFKEWFNFINEDYKKDENDIHLRIARDVLNSVDDMICDNTVMFEDVED